jgi:hypothetical protein
MNDTEKRFVEAGDTEEAERRMFDRTADQRKNYALSGYMLVKGYAVTRTGHYLTASGAETDDPKKAKTTYKFTPFVDWCNFLRDKKTNEPEDIVAFMNDANGDYGSWLQAQEKIKNAIGANDGNTFERMRLEFLKWLIISELAGKKSIFQKMTAGEKIKIVNGMFRGLSEAAHRIHFISWEGALEEITFPSFGKFMVDDVEEMLKEAGWLRPAPFDIRLRAEVNKIKNLAKLAAATTPKPEVL